MAAMGSFALSNSTTPALVRWSLGACGAATLFIAVCLWLDLQPSAFHPHGWCYLWSPTLIALYAGSDIVIGLSYVAISGTLLYLVHRARHALPFSWLFVAFGVFIVSCGLTHFMDVVTLWFATFWVSADIRVITAIASLATALALPGAIPVVLAVLESARLSESRRLDLEQAHDELESRVAARTSELAASEARYRQLLDATNEGVLTLDADNRITYGNARLALLLGYEIDALLGEPAERVLSDGASIGAALAREVEELPETEVILRAQDGSLRWTLVSIHRLDGSDQRAGRLVMVTDQTHRHYLEDKLRQVHKLEAVGRLAGGVAHDFNNLITAMYGSCELLADRLPATDPQARAYLNDIRQMADRAAQLTHQLLAFSRQQMLQPRVVSLNEVVDGARRMFERVIGEDVNLVVAPGDGVGRVRADPGQLGQVLLNLVANARDAMPDGGTLTVETSNVEVDDTFATRHPALARGQYSCISVSDTGVGIEPEMLPHIFEPFFTTKGERGTGLGLATVYGIVKQSGGDIWVYSESGLGTTFRVVLPSVDAPLDAEADASVDRPLTGDECVLVVEDDPLVRATMVAALLQRGYDVLQAGLPAEALTIAGDRNGPIDLMVSDMVMPGMTGPQLEKELLQGRPDLKTLFVSGYSDRLLFASAVVDRARHFLQKPFSPGALARKVREVLEAT